MPRVTIDQIRNLGDFQQTHRWDFQVVSAPAAVAGFPDSNGVNLRCESSEIPYRTNNKPSTAIRGHKIFQNGTVDYNGSIKLSFVETTDGFIRQMVKALHDAMYDRVSGVSAGSSNDLSFDILLTQLNNQDVPVWQYKLIGCQLESETMGSLEAGENEGSFQKPELTFKFLKFEDNAV